MGGTNYFEGLNYTLGDEDSTVEHGMLPQGAGRVVAVAGSGGRVVPLLAASPGHLTCVDVSPNQLELTRFRLAAVARLAREDYLGLLGYEPMSEPRRLSMASGLGWRSPSGAVERLLRTEGGLVYQGRFERMLASLARVSAIVLGDARHRLFECVSLEEQRTFLRDGFPWRRWRLLIGVLGNSAVLNALLYRGAFPRKNRPGSHASIYRDMLGRLLHDVLARRSFFLQMVLLGRVRLRDGYPVECDPRVYEAAQSAALTTRIAFEAGDIVRHMATSPPADFVSLSDVPSFLPPPEAVHVLERLRNGVRRGGLVVMRGHMRVIDPAISGFARATERYRDLIASETTQLWRIDAYLRT